MDAMEEVETVVIGAGVIGLATARALARTGREVLILEAEDAFGTQTSARNSEVIHAGVYYARDSLKARFCVEGKRRLYDYCRTRHVAHSNCGKLIVACDNADRAKLPGIAAKAKANGVDDLRQLSAQDAAAMEPALACVAALWSPSTGTVDSHGLMLSLLGEAEAAGAMLALNAPLSGLTVEPDHCVLSVTGPAPMNLKARRVVNAAGLCAPAIANAASGLPANFAIPTYLAKGNYFGLTGRAPFSRLIYPTPQTNTGLLGVHLTLDQAGLARFGPDEEWVTRQDYAVDPARGAAFYAAIRRYWPDLPDNALTPDYAGIRPRLFDKGQSARDFEITSHGAQSYLGLYGVESPGLTSCLAIAAHVAERFS